MNRFENMAMGARQLCAKFMAYPYGDKDNAVDVTDAVMDALEIAGRHTPDTEKRRQFLNTQAMTCDAIEIGLVEGDEL